jgi:hypothetical protein
MPETIEATPLLALEKQSQSLTGQAIGFDRIQDADQYQIAVELGRALRGIVNGINEYWKKTVKDAYDLHKSLVAKRAEALEAPKAAMDHLGSLVTDYDNAQRRIAEENSRRANEALRKQQEAEALERAASLEASGDTQGANQVLHEALEAPGAVVVAPVNIPETKGKSSRTNWSFVIENAALIPREYLVPDTSKIGQVVRALKANHGIAGIKACDTSKTTFRE